MSVISVRSQKTTSRSTGRGGRARCSSSTPRREQGRSCIPGARPTQHGLYTGLNGVNGVVF
jgi:hypothetical protein